MKLGDAGLDAVTLEFTRGVVAAGQARQEGLEALQADGVQALTWRSLDAYRQAPLGVALALLAALGWAGGTMIIKRSGVAVPATVLSGWQLLVASIPVTLCALAIDGGTGSWPSPMVLLAIAYITIVPMGVGNVVWFAIVGLLPAHRGTARRGHPDADRDPPAGGPGGGLHAMELSGQPAGAQTGRRAGRGLQRRHHGSPRRCRREG